MATLQNLALAAQGMARKSIKPEERKIFETCARNIEKLLVKIHRFHVRFTLLTRFSWIIVIPVLWFAVLMVATTQVDYDTTNTASGNAGQIFWQSLQLLPIYFWILFGIGSIIAILIINRAFKLWTGITLKFLPITGNDALTKQELIELFEKGDTTDNKAVRTVTLRGAKIQLPGTDTAEWKEFVSYYQLVSPPAAD